MRLAFVTTSVVISTKQILQQSKVLGKAHCLTVVAIVVVLRIEVVGIEVHVVRVVLIVLCTRPIVAVVANIVHIRTPAVATCRKEHRQYKVVSLLKDEGLAP